MEHLPSNISGSSLEQSSVVMGDIVEEHRADGLCEGVVYAGYAQPN